MSVLKMTSHTDAEGELHLDVGVPNSKVQVTLVIEDESHPKVGEEARAEWEAFVRRTAGSIKDPKFRRQPQGEFPKRERFK